VAALYVVVPFSDPPRLVSAAYSPEATVVTCLAGVVSKAAPVIVQGERAEELAERLRTAGYRSVVVRECENELNEQT
jgi:hypothetical protein